MTMCQVVLICFYPTILFVVITNNLEIGSLKQENIYKKGFCEKNTLQKMSTSIYVKLKVIELFTGRYLEQNYYLFGLFTQKNPSFVNEKYLIDGMGRHIYSSSDPYWKERIGDRAASCINLNLL